MEHNLKLLWKTNETIEVSGEINDYIRKISNIENHLYFLTASHKLYHGVVQTKNGSSFLHLECKDDFKLVDIDTCRSELYIVNTEGSVFICDDNLETTTEICLSEDTYCARGHIGNKINHKVTKIAVGEYGQLFVAESGHLWGSGCMPQIAVDTKAPKRVSFFSGRQIQSVNVGNDFAVVIVSKHNKANANAADSDEEDVFLSNCPQCLSASQLTSPASQNSISEMCPLGVKIQGSYDIETTSTSSKNDSSISLNDAKKDSVEQLDSKENKVERNIIFRNTEAAKEFLTRQISRMSSAGEEYLVECTEKPTRIIKENMTNVASFVYEGVKTVGDKVVTLSRHVSGSSDYNSNIESIEKNVVRSTSRDDLILSIGQCTPEKDASEHGLQDNVEMILKTGSALLNCEVWTWGNIVHGQLDEQEHSEDVMFMPSEDVSVHTVHQLFQKLFGSYHEYNLPSTPGYGDIIKRERPMIISKLSNIGVHKASVQSYHTSVLTLDGRCFIWGRNNHNQVTIDSDMDQSSPKLFVTSRELRIKDVVCSSHSSTVLTNKSDIIYFGENARGFQILHTTCSSENNLQYKVNLFESLVSSGEYTLFNVNYFEDDVFLDFVTTEQRTLEEMLTVHTNIIKQLQKKSSNFNNSILYDNLCKHYVDLLHFRATNINSLLEHSNRLISPCDIVMFKYLPEYIFIYKNYIDSIYNIISIDGLQQITKAIEVPPCLYKLRPDSFPKKDKNVEEQVVSTYLLDPVCKLESYTAITQHFLKSSSSDHKFKEILIMWSEFVEERESKKKQAESTKEFWLNSGKTLEFLKSCDRRLVRDSHKYPINLQNSSRFSSHWFILFTDLFVHVNGSTPHLHNLTTIWLEPQQDESSTQHQISLKMPEETLILCTTEPEAKIEWFHALQNAIKCALNKLDALQPPAVRNGSYTFTKSGFFKDATYTGRWLNAKMHGTGRIKWSDGKTYTGQFSHNQICGYGNMETPNVGLYEGQWKENQQNGFGVLTYSNSDFYKGYFKDGVAHGHGFLRKGKFTSNAASFYIGDWVCGMKSGYGVMDDIVTGEKYIGNWSDNKKQGSGLIVTSDGIYYEGTFAQDVLTGQGVMILEDGTRYEGEFKGTGILYGKGTLTLQSGHTIEGAMTGSLSEGIKISNGVFSRGMSKKTSKEPEVTVLLHHKWKSLFSNCYQILGIPENNVAGNKNTVKPPDTHKIWQNVAVYLSNSSTTRKKAENKLQNTLNHLDIIPPFGREKMDVQTSTDVKHYLLKAFESTHHPLGSLLNDLSEAYTTTYGGKAHPLLLTHAISELHYLIKRIYEIVRCLFPALPHYDNECFVDNKEGEEVVSYQSLLYPIVLPKVHHPLFSLFTLKNELQERQYKRTLIEWNKQTDYTLMAFLCVDQKFFKTDDAPFPPGSPVRHHLFIDAIETLQQLKSTFSPTEKLIVIRQTIERMTPVAQQLLGENYVWNMDDLFPIFLYVVVRARIPELGSELDFIDNFMDPSLESGELGIMFTTLKASYQQILQEKSSTF